jgi:hypothetical protein
VHPFGCDQGIRRDEYRDRECDLHRRDNRCVRR